MCLECLRFSDAYFVGLGLAFRAWEDLVICSTQ